MAFNDRLWFSLVLLRFRTPSEETVWGKRKSSRRGEAPTCKTDDPHANNLRGALPLVQVRLLQSQLDQRSATVQESEERSLENGLDSHVLELQREFLFTWSSQRFFRVIEMFWFSSDPFRRGQSTNQWAEIQTSKGGAGGHGSRTECEFLQFGLSEDNTNSFLIAQMVFG